MKVMDRRGWRIAVLALLVSSWAFGQVLFRTAHLDRHAHAAASSPLSHDACALCQLQEAPLLSPGPVATLVAPPVAVALPTRVLAAPLPAVVSRRVAEVHLRGPPSPPHA